jgi:alpha-L-fucosidase 2
MSAALKLWYRQPAGRWEESLPLGNGFLGAMIRGDTARETIGLNEGSLWSGYNRDKNNPHALETLPEARRLIFAGEYAKAQALLEKRMLGEYTESYLPLGNLLIDFHASGEATDYARELDLGDACARVSYAQGGVRFARECFASNPHRALFMRLTASKPILHVTFRFQSELRCDVRAEGRSIRIAGQCPDHVDPDYTGSADPIVWGERGIRFTAALTLLNTDGTAAADGEGLSVTGATQVTLAFTAVHNPDVAAAYAALGWAGLKAAHTEDYRRLYGRVSLDLGEQPDLPTDERLARLREGGEDAPLCALYIQYGRYLTSAASREGGLPKTLQGLWNWQMQPPWSCNYTTNINAQMNYWPALACGLKECLPPYFSFLQRIAEHGRETARVHFGCRGFTLSHNTDRWACAQPVGVVHGHAEGVADSGRYAFFPLGGVWMCQELWRYYTFTEDRAFLADTAFPLLRDAALFCSDFLIEHEGSLVACPSASPENAFTAKNGDSASVAWGCTMDMTLVRESFDHFQKACAALGRDDELLPVIAAQKRKLLPYRVGRYGQLLEWCEDFDEPEPGHRHLSHLYGLFPGSCSRATKR